MSSTINQKLKEDVISALRGLVQRAEARQSGSETNYLDTIVPIVDFETLSGRNNEILYGRNGTGKTHLLRAYEQYCYRNFQTTKVLPVYIDCRDLDVHSVGEQIAIDRLLSIFYKRLIRKILIDLKGFTEQVVTPGILEILFGRDAKSRRQEINVNLAKLNELLDEDTIERSVKSFVDKSEKERSLGGKISGGLGLSLSGRDLQVGPDAKIGVEVAGARARNSTRKIETVYSGLAVIDYDQLRDCIERIVRNSGASSVVILIDEWSDIPSGIQPLMAEMVRKTIGSSNLINFKIAALKFFTSASVKLPDGRRIGLTAANLGVIADLDLLLRYETQKLEVKGFLTSMLYKHLTNLNPKLDLLTIGEFQSMLTSQIFDTDKSYEELVRSSEGNPRDFIRLVGLCCRGLDTSSKPISAQKVVDAAKTHFHDNKQPDINDDKMLTSAFDNLFRLVTSKGSKLFVVSSYLSDDNIILRELWHYRFVHLVQRKITVLSEGDVKDFDVYAIDYGKLVSLKATKEGEKQFQRIIDLTESISKLILQSNIIDERMHPLIKSFNLKKEEFEKNEGFKRLFERNVNLQEPVPDGTFDGIEKLIADGCVADAILLPPKADANVGLFSKEKARKKPQRATKTTG